MGTPCDSFETIDDDGEASVERERGHRRITINQTRRKSGFKTNAISTAKYSIYTFLPKFLFEQFRRYTNLFFLFVALMQQIPGVSPTGRHTTLIPLIIILIISATKEIIEDFKRYLDDVKVNTTLTTALRLVDDGEEPQWVAIKWREVKVGDFLRISSGQYFPADMILLSSSGAEQMCYVETANLDGETDLKPRRVPRNLPLWTSDVQLAELSGAVNCDSPNRHLYEFSGNIDLESRTEIITVGRESVLLRGAKLENTDWVFGFVIYTGRDSKLLMNSPRAHLKRSTIERLLNSQITMMFFILITISLISAVSSAFWRLEGRAAWYIPPGGFSENIAFSFLTFSILYNNLIPISLNVALEIVRYVQASFINHDLEMYSEESGMFARARTSNLNEELGCVKYIFSDKTGTLTCNKMEFKCCSIGCHTFGNADVGASRASIEAVIKKGDELATRVKDFLKMMAVCHAVFLELEGDAVEPTYQAASPDEVALVKGAAKLGVELKSRKTAELTIEVFGHLETYEILSVLEFTSDRKRMSLIVRNKDGRITLMCKGADSVIYERLSSANKQAVLESVQNDLKRFSSQGLRILCFAARDLTSDEFSRWHTAYELASSAIIDRKRKVAEASDLIERELDLCGASAIEDRLQDGVPDTIAGLLEAEIKVWVLTGDKRETAINIGYSTRLLETSTELLLVGGTTADSTREEILLHLADRRQTLPPKNNLGLVIDGGSLEFALQPDLVAEFRELALGVKVVICCRVSPKQKADVVNMVRRESDAATLAIGDGANDVPMIQAAHVGIGISGVEGLQAVYASDYSISQFRFLRRLLFVHGAWNHTRVSKLIMYTFHKNVCLYLIGLWYALYSGWSGQTLFERWSMAAYNLLFTGAPSIAIGLLDKTGSAETMMNFPVLYRVSQREIRFSKKTFWMWISKSVYHSLVLFYGSKSIMSQDVAWGHGKDGGYLMLGNMCYTFVVITVCLKAGLEINAWSWPVHAAIWGSICCWFIFLISYSGEWKLQLTTAGADMSGMALIVFSSGLFWLGCILIPVSALLLDVTVIVAPYRGAGIRLLNYLDDLFDGWRSTGVDGPTVTEATGSQNRGKEAWDSSSGSRKV